MRFAITSKFAIVTIGAVVGVAVHAATPSGQRIFQNNCAMCHSASPDMATLAGPPLFNVVGRKVAAAKDFAYSNALSAIGANGRHWTAQELDIFLRDPSAYAPGTTMPVAVTQPGERAALIKYLATAQGKAVAPGKARSASIAGSSKQESWSDDKPGRIREVRIADLPAPFASASAGNNPRTVPRPQGTLPAVPDNFNVNLWATDPDRGRVMVRAPNGDIFISSTTQRLIKVFRSKSGVTAETVSVFASKLDRPFGFAFWPVGPDPRYLYVANVNSIVRFPYRNGDLVAGAAPEVVVPTLTAETGSHSSRTLVFAADSKTMYLSIGSASNVAEGIGPKPPLALAQWEARHGLGAAWGSELDRALVLAFDPDGKNKRTFATGLRNCVGMYLYPRTGELLCSVNERDMLGDDLPPDYLTRVKAGAHYGWPWHYIGSHEEPRLKGHRPDLRGKVTAPDLLLTAHSAPLGMIMYNASPSAQAAFPKDYNGDLFLALHGSWNRTSRTGSKVVRVFMKDGVPTGKYQDFMTGFVVSDKEVWGRPSSVVVQDDGSLLVDDDVTGEIWRVAPKRNR
ncbi:PQQ-dependent sugar dehydrogenase [Pseudoduganella lutea]|uniref:C-type cytochrome n=1 Tax=Pseudoduganella lutea TaxID=321985 RepID=A0A4P6L4X6_9BURK|nr:PQQ-dependent sugar dehydrogenase [Pseudoduganella lutea]QBE66395.1 c-type cytochrome [Pseudoduganella lutea]